VSLVSQTEGVDAGENRLLRKERTLAGPNGVGHHTRAADAASSSGIVVRGLVAQDSWLTKWLRREPIRPYKGRGVGHVVARFGRPLLEHGAI
jgi:hypothetical protein